MIIKVLPECSLGEDMFQCLKFKFIKPGSSDTYLVRKQTALNGHVFFTKVLIENSVVIEKQLKL